MLDLLGGSLSSIVDLLYPPKCPFCDSFVEKRDRACAPCLAKLIPLETDANISLDVRTWFSRARSCFAYEDPVRGLIHAFKYSGKLDATRYLAGCLHAEIDSLRPFDSIVTVPMEGARLVSRGLDPCALMARRFAKISSVPFMPGLLVRMRSIPPQVGLERVEREKNVKGAFAVRPKFRRSVAGRRLLIVDDVLTTGATLNDCARALMKAGAREVMALTVARTL